MKTLIAKFRIWGYLWCLLNYFDWIQNSNMALQWLVYATVREWKIFTWKAISEIGQTNMSIIMTTLCWLWTLFSLLRIKPWSFYCHVCLWVINLKTYLIPVCQFKSHWPDYSLRSQLSKSLMRILKLTLPLGNLNCKVFSLKCFLKEEDLWV